MEAAAFRQLALDQLDAVYRMAYHLTHHPDEASDLVQETYLRALRAEASFELRDHGVKPWLFKILHNAFYTKLSKAKRSPTLVEDLQHQAAADELNTPSPCWDLSTLDWEQTDDRLKTAIAELPTHYREVLLLWAVEGLKYREVADVLNLALGTVMSRLYRARAILSKKLAELAAEHGIKLEPPNDRQDKLSPQSPQR